MSNSIQCECDANLEYRPHFKSLNCRRKRCITALLKWVDAGERLAIQPDVGCEFHPAIWISEIWKTSRIASAIPKCVIGMRPLFRRNCLPHYRQTQSDPNSPRVKFLFKAASRDEARLEKGLSSICTIVLLPPFHQNLTRFADAKPQ